MKASPLPFLTEEEYLQHTRSDTVIRNSKQIRMIKF